MVKKVWQTDRRTDGQTDGLNQSYICLVTAKNKEYRFIEVCIERAHSKNMYTIQNKANLRNLIAATGQVILLKLDSNRRFFSPCDLEITLKSGKICNFLSRVTLKFDGWPLKTIGQLFYIVSSFVHHFIGISEFKVELQSGNAQFWSKLSIFLTVWSWN